MKRNVRVIQINGIRGLLLAVFVTTCLIAGFVVFPAFLTMHIWNYLAITSGSFPTINFYQGILLWAIITFSIYIFNKKKFIVSFNSQQELTDDELKDVISKIKAQSQSGLNLGLNKEIKENKEMSEVHNKNDN